MEASSPRWRQITPSQYAWEADALATLRALLPDTDPFHAWTNFEFTDGGRIYEVDAFVVTPKGVFLTEIKSWSGKVGGNQGQWVQERRDGSVQSYGNAANLTAAKARSIASLIKRNWPGGPTAPRYVYVDHLVWFSNPNLRVQLPTELHRFLAVADDAETKGKIQSITDAIITIGEGEAKQANFQRITAQQANALAATMERIGFKESTRKRTAGSYELQLPAFAERGSTQDFLAKHKHQGLRARVRIYSNVVGATPEEAKALKDAAQREFVASRNLRIDGVVPATDFDITEFGPAVIFEHNPKAVRLDRFLAERGDELDLDTRLDLLEQVASTCRTMHARKITHRMMTPESIWLRPTRTDSAGVVTWAAQVSDFSLAARDSTAATTTATYTRVGSIPAVRTGAVDVVLGDASMETYLAPETYTASDSDGVALDIYSLGALTYLLVTGRAPGSNREELRAALGQGGLSITATNAEVDDGLERLVRRCTTPIVSDRLDDVSTFIDELSLVRARLRGEEPGDVDPLTAQPDAVLADRFVVKDRLGKGSTAVALWCYDRAHDRDVVLKVSLGEHCDERLAVEAEALRSLKQQNVVELYEELSISNRAVLVLSFAGSRSLARYLREEGAASTDFLRRWGGELLEAVRYLDREGVFHRDMKPDNLGIVEMGTHRRTHLVLFDFSLAGTPADDIRAGTPPYLDPFLADEGRGRYDVAAEMYAAAVTIHEMATGETPTWGDGQSDPAFVPDAQPTIFAEGIDPEVRAAVVGFLSRALRHDPAERFDTPDDMARAWLAAFAAWEASDREEIDGSTAGASVAPNAATVDLPANLTLDDPVSSLTGSGKVRSAFRKLGAETVREVAALDALTVNKTRGVSVKTRKVVLRLRAAVLDRFADDLATTTPPSVPRTSGAAVAAGEEVSDDGTSVEETGQPTRDTTDLRLAETYWFSAPPTSNVTVLRPDLDQLALALVPPRGKRGKAGSVADTVRTLLGLEPLDGADDWPTASAVATAMGVTAGAVSNSLAKARAHWGGSAALNAVAADLLSILGDLGAVAGVTELTRPLLDLRGSGHDDTQADRIAAAVLRAVLESDAPSAEWFSLRRFGARTVVAVNGPALARVADGGTADLDRNPGFEFIAQVDPAELRRLADVDPVAMISLAVALGARADELIGASVAEGPTLLTPVVPGADAVAALRTVRPEISVQLSDARLVRLGAACSDHAAANAASDLVPRAIEPADAVRWSRTALVGANRLTPGELAARVAARFPAVRLPERPELDALVAAAQLPLVWSPAEHAYLPNAAGPGGIGPLTIATSRWGTELGTDGATVPPAEPSDPATVAAIEIDERLGRSIESGGFLALRVPTDRLADARRNLARFQNDGLAVVDLEAAFLGHLRAAAAERKVSWSNLEGADDPDDASWPKLAVVAADAIDATIAEVAGHERVIAWFPGALVRYADRAAVAPLDRLRDAVLSGDNPVTTLWLVVLGGSADALPSVDGTPVPALAASQWLDLTDNWLKNAHRSGGLSA